VLNEGEWLPVFDPGCVIKQARAEHHGDDQRQLHHFTGQHLIQAFPSPQLKLHELSNGTIEIASLFR
jgi:hypothetical protein